MSENSEKQRTEESGRTDATGEFFSVGTPLHAVRAGYIRRRADDLLYEAAIAGRYAHIIAPDRSGKSSLIAATAARLEHNNVNVAVLDLEQIGDREGGKDAGRWYYNVAYRLLRQLRIRYDLQSWWQDKSVLSNRQRLLEFYAEIILQNVQQQIVVFVDGIQCIASLPFADQLLASVRSAHNARTTDPDFSRITFILIGECDPLSLVNEPELSPFNATQPVPLDDFRREDLNLFATELNLNSEDARLALDRIYYWTRGQPYLSQKLARAMARESVTGDIAGHVDRIVTQQLAGRAALHSEPHMSHIHREIVSSGKNVNALLNLYGKLRKGIHVPADLGSADQRRLMAVGLIEVDEAGELKVRNRIYEAVFTARWANENLTTQWRAPAIAVAVLLLIAAIPLWYTQGLPKSYVAVLTTANAELSVARTTWMNLRSFPGHGDTADGLYRAFLIGRANISDDVAEIQALSTMASELPDAAMFPQTLRADFWERRMQTAMREERRDDALLASLQTLAVSTPRRRNRSAMLVGSDYPLLLASSPPGAPVDFAFNPSNLLLTSAQGSRISQWSLGPDGLSRGEDWLMTALEVLPLVRRVIVDREGVVRRIGLSLRISHLRIADLRVRVIAPSGKAVEVDVSREPASADGDVRIPATQLRELLGESMLGTWSISFRDEATGVIGFLDAWNLSLNSEALFEDFERGLSIPDPAERETEQFWINDDGRYAVARATQSDSARLWDVAFAKPISSIAVNENEQLIGVDKGARRLVTATLDTVNLWDTATGRRMATLPISSASGSSTMTEDGRHLFVQHRSDVETRLELWNLDTAVKDAELIVAGAPALVSVDASGGRIAIADYDRALRIWDFESGEMLVQLDLPKQPSEIKFNASGKVLSAIYGNAGVSVWELQRPDTALLETMSEGSWQIAFSPSGARFVAGKPDSGFQIYETEGARLVGPAIGAGGNRSAGDLLGFSNEEDVIVTSGPTGNVRFWQLPVATLATDIDNGDHSVWTPSGDALVAAMPNASAIAVGDRVGHVHLMATNIGGEQIAVRSEDISFLGHNTSVRLLTVSADGRKLASVGDDNMIRVWDPETGLPQSFITYFPGSIAERVVFSDNAHLLGILAGSRAAIMDVETGDLLAELELGEVHTSIAFSNDDQLYLGGNSGALNVVNRDSAGVWNLRRLWAGNAPIRRLEASPRGRYLLVVDSNDQAQLLNLKNGQPGKMMLTLPAAVEDVVFSPDGSRVLFRTARWVHRVGASGNGLIWLESTIVPKALNGSRIVFGDPTSRDSSSGNAFYLPISRDGIAHLAHFRFVDSDGPGLFGNKDELLEEWRRKLMMTPDDPVSPN
ncbi:MAG: AAA-like domain-containing protein [Gammaproteobacteria bacterium]|nr:AAA-like domain-containing protein [Gammaproteobacteria bacterium]